MKSKNTEIKMDIEKDFSSNPEPQRPQNHYRRKKVKIRGPKSSQLRIVSISPILKKCM